VIGVVFVADPCDLEMASRFRMSQHWHSPFPSHFGPPTTLARIGPYATAAASSCRKRAFGAPWWKPRRRIGQVDKAQLESIFVEEPRSLKARLRFRLRSAAGQEKPC
jgi:hypothetical protein